jgi:hypothetical protein
MTLFGGAFICEYDDNVSMHTGNSDLHSTSIWQDHICQHVCSSTAFLLLWMRSIHLLNLQTNLHQASEKCHQVSAHHLPGKLFVSSFFGTGF